MNVEEGPTGETPPYGAGRLVALPEGGRARGTFGAVALLVGRHRGGRLSEWTMVVTGTLPAPAGAFLHRPGPDIRLAAGVGICEGLAQAAMLQHALGPRGAQQTAEAATSGRCEQFEDVACYSWRAPACRSWRTVTRCRR